MWMQFTNNLNQEITNNMTNNKQNSVDYLIEQLLPKALSAEQFYHIQQAKAMHKEEIMEAHFAPKYGCFSEQYYNETFGGNNEQ